MAIFRGNTVVAGATNMVNVETLDAYFEQLVAVFTEAEWEDLSEEQKASYKLALVY